jgi:maleamate amidohydrolase
MSTPSWNNFLTDQDRAVLDACGQGAAMGLGQRPAILVIDVNYAFCGETSLPILDSIQQWKRSCGEVAWQAVPAIQALIATGRVKDVPIIYTTGFERSGHWRRGGSDWKKSWTNEREAAPQSALKNSRLGTDIIDEIAPHDDDIIVAKQKPSAFHEAPLESHLTMFGIDSLIVCGTTTSGCVRATVTDAFSRNYRVAVVEDACFDRLQSSHAMTLLDLNLKYADVISSKEALAYLSALGAHKE